MAVVWATSILLDIAIWVDLYPPNLCHTTESSGVYNFIGEKLTALRKSCYTKERSLRIGWLTIDSFPFCSRLSWHICNWELKAVGGEGGGCGAGRENSNWWGGDLRELPCPILRLSNSREEDMVVSCSSGLEQVAATDDNSWLVTSAAVSDHYYQQAACTGDSGSVNQLHMS